MSDPTVLPEEAASSSPSKRVVPRSPSPQSDLVSLSSTSDESLYSDAQSPSQEESDEVEAIASTAPSINLGETPDSQRSGHTPSSGQGQSAEQPLSSAGLQSASSPGRTGSGVQQQAGSSSAQYTGFDASRLRVGDYESAGLLYARATKARDNM